MHIYISTTLIILPQPGQRIRLLHHLLGTFCFIYSTGFDEAKKTADFLRTRTKHLPLIGIICGSGLVALVNHLDETEAFPYEDIPGFPITTGEFPSFLYSINTHILLLSIRKIIDRCRWGVKIL